MRSAIATYLTFNADADYPTGDMSGNRERFHNASLWSSVPNMSRKPADFNQDAVPFSFPISRHNYRGGHSNFSSWECGLNSNRIQPSQSYMQPVATSSHHFKRPYNGDRWSISEDIRTSPIDAGRVPVDRSRFSRKVFVGGLPVDITEDEIVNQFSKFGQVEVTWPYKHEQQSNIPPHGYAFIIFHNESSVFDLVDACSTKDRKHYFPVSSRNVPFKNVQVRPWFVSDSDCIIDRTVAINPRQTIFVGGVPRPMKAQELAAAMEAQFGNVVYAGIDVDPILKYPRGAGRVTFINQDSFMHALLARAIRLPEFGPTAAIEIKPYVLDRQPCDQCKEAEGPFFCSETKCLQYYCRDCWWRVHDNENRKWHRAFVKGINRHPELQVSLGPIPPER